MKTATKTAMKTATVSDKFRLCMAFKDDALHQTAHTHTLELTYGDVS